MTTSPPTTAPTAGSPRHPASSAQPERRDRTLRIVAGVLAALFLLAFGGLPTLLSAPFATLDAGAHALHQVAEGLHLTLYGVTMALFAAVRPWRPAALQLYLAAGLPAVLVSALLLDGVAVTASLLVTALPALLLSRLTPAPERRTLFAGGGFSAPLVGMALLAAVPLGRYAWVHLGLQRSLPVHEAHAALHHWSGMAVFAITIVSLALVVARRPAGWVPAALVTGGFVALLGTGSLALSPIASSLGAVGGWAALGGGLAFALAARVVARATPDGGLDQATARSTERE